MSHTQKGYYKGKDGTEDAKASILGADMEREKKQSSAQLTCRENARLLQSMNTQTPRSIGSVTARSISASLSLQLSFKGVGVDVPLIG